MLFSIDIQHRWYRNLKKQWRKLAQERASGHKYAQLREENGDE
jgi:hypothetical protein